MAKQTTKNPLLTKYASKANKYVQQHAEDATTYGLIRLPPGITSGKAKLEELEFTTVGEGKENTGKLCFRGMGTIYEPEYVVHNGSKIKVKGLQTRIWRPAEPMGEDQSWDANLETIMNDLRQIGGEDYTQGCTTLDDIDALAKELVDVGPFFKFSTSESPAVLNKDGTVKYEKRTWENWHGSKGLEDYTPPSITSETQDDTGGDDTDKTETTPSKNGQTATKAAVTNRIKPGKVAAQEEDFNEFNDLDSLATLADESNDKAAAAKIKKAAIDAGVSADDIEGANDWTSVVAMIANLTNQEEGGGEEGTTEEGQEDNNEQQEEDGEATEEGGGEEQAVNPAVGETWNYRDPATNKVSTVQVSAVSTKRETVDAVNVKNKKIVLKGIAWKSLESV